MRRTTFFLSLAAGTLLTGCLNTNEPRPLSITLAVQPSSPIAGQRAVFTVSARGESMNNIRIAFGDGIMEDFPLAAARTLEVNFPHTYAGAGTYAASATAFDDRAGSKTVELSVVVQ